MPSTTPRMKWRFTAAKHFALNVFLYNQVIDRYKNESPQQHPSQYWFSELCSPITIHSYVVGGTTIIRVILTTTPLTYCRTGSWLHELFLNATILSIAVFSVNSQIYRTERGWGLAAVWLSSSEYAHQMNWTYLAGLVCGYRTNLLNANKLTKLARNSFKFSPLSFGNSGPPPGQDENTIIFIEGDDLNGASDSKRERQRAQNPWPRFVSFLCVYLSHAH